MSLQNDDERKSYISEVLKRMKHLLSDEQITSIGPLIADIVEADGIVMTSEMKIVALSEEILNINIRVQD